MNLFSRIEDFKRYLIIKLVMDKVYFWYERAQSRVSSTSLGFFGVVAERKREYSLLKVFEGERLDQDGVGLGIDIDLSQPIRVELRENEAIVYDVHCRGEEIDQEEFIKRLQRAGQTGNKLIEKLDRGFKKLGA